MSSVSPTATATTAPRWPHVVTGRITAVLRHPWIAPVVRLDALEDTLQALRPTLSLSSVRARVRHIIQETPDTKTFVLRPNSLWAGARAGQFVRVRVEIDGRRHERAYSLTSLPGAKHLAITVKRQPEGVVSRYLHDAVRPGTVLALSQAAGEFVLPDQLPDKILLLSAGSGITPVMAMLRELRARDYRGDIVFYHVCASVEEFIFSQQVQDIAAQWPTLRVLSHFSADAGRWQAAFLKAVTPDLGQRATWMCGPVTLMDNVRRLWTDEAYASPLYSERFTAAPLQLANTAGVQGAGVNVQCSASGTQFTARSGEPLLQQAERAGLTPKHGCRMGICHSCQCMKTSGSVENLQTGEISSAPDELIRLCISAARSDLAIDL